MGTQIEIIESYAIAGEVAEKLPVDIFEKVKTEYLQIKKTTLINIEQLTNFQAHRKKLVFKLSKIRRNYLDFVFYRSKYL